MGILDGYMYPPAILVKKLVKNRNRKASINLCLHLIHILYSLQASLLSWTTDPKKNDKGQKYDDSPRTFPPSRHGVDMT